MAIGTTFIVHLEIFIKEMISPYRRNGSSMQQDSNGIFRPLWPQIQTEGASFSGTLRRYRARVEREIPSKRAVRRWFRFACS